MNKKYYVFTNHGKIVFLGNFSSYEKAYEYAEYDRNINFVWILNEEKLKNLKSSIEVAISS